MPNRGDLPVGGCQARLFCFAIACLLWVKSTSAACPRDVRYTPKADIAGCDWIVR